MRSWVTETLPEASIWTIFTSVLVSLLPDAEALIATARTSVPDGMPDMPRKTLPYLTHGTRIETAPSERLVDTPTPMTVDPSIPGTSTEEP